MSWAKFAIEALQRGETVQIKPHHRRALQTGFTAKR
jgi:hypothetical protein